MEEIKSVLSDYQHIFGDLDFSSSLEEAEDELKALIKKKERLETGQNDSIQQKKLSMATCEERLAAYDSHQGIQAAANKRMVDNLVDLTTLDTEGQMEKNNRMKSRLELMAEERDYKRRRQSYKGGKSGSAKRSYTEVIRDVIDTQSEMLRTMASDDRKKVKREPHR